MPAHPHEGRLPSGGLHPGPQPGPLPGLNPAHGLQLKPEQMPPAYLPDAALGHPQVSPPLPHQAARQGHSSLASTIHDLRKGSMTQARAKEILSSYAIMRIEKVQDDPELDQHGRLLAPTWEKSRHSLLTDFSQFDAARRVRDLDYGDKDVVAKKAALDIPVQRQLEHAQRLFEAQERDPRFVYLLAQFESKLVPLQHSPRAADKDSFPRRSASDFRRLKSSHSHKKHKSKSKSREPSEGSASKSRSSKVKERVAVTAYFMRTPRPGEDAIAMLCAIDHDYSQRRQAVPPPHRLQQVAQPTDGRHPPSIEGPLPPRGHPAQTPLAPGIDAPQRLSAPGHPAQPPLAPGIDAPQRLSAPGPPVAPAVIPLGTPAVPVTPGAPRGPVRTKIEVLPDRPNVRRSMSPSSRGSESDRSASSRASSTTRTPSLSRQSSSQSSRKSRGRDWSRSKSAPANFGLEVPRLHATDGKGPGADGPLLPRDLPFPAGRGGLSPLEFDAALRERERQAFLDGFDHRDSLMAARLVEPRPRIVQSPLGPPRRRAPTALGRGSVFRDGLSLLKDGLGQVNLEDGPGRCSPAALWHEVSPRYQDHSPRRQRRTRESRDIFDDFDYGDVDYDGGDDDVYDNDEDYNWRVARGPRWSERRAHDYMGSARGRRGEGYREAPFRPGGRRQVDTFYYRL